MSYPQALSYYKKVNVAGLLNDFACSPPVATRRLNNATTKLSNHRATPQQGIDTALKDRLLLAENQFHGAYKMNLIARRISPPSWLDFRYLCLPRTYVGGRFHWMLVPTGGAVPALLLHPIAELLFGRGQSVAAPPASMRTLDNLSNAYDQMTRHGLLGTVLEKAPKAAATYFHTHNRTTLASACMYAAVLGRVLLQYPRLVVAGAITLSSLLTAYEVTLALTLLSWQLQAIRTGLSLLPAQAPVVPQLIDYCSQGITLLDGR